MIHLTATFHAQPGKEQELKAVLTRALEPTRNEEGCVRYQLFQDKDNACHFVFQEQFMEVIHKLGDISLVESDTIRSALGKKDKEKLHKFEEKFVAGASPKIGELKAKELWLQIEKASGYSFNRSHAVAYSLLSYWTAWLKHYYPLEFVFALLKNEKDKDTRTDYLLEAKRLGIRILLPHINESELDFSIQGNSIRFGLSNVKFISDNIGNKIISKRPYSSYRNFLDVTQAKNSGINSRAVQALNSVGASAFKDNPRQGSESENLYEYLGIPKFDTGKLSPKIKSQVNPLEEFIEQGCFVLLAMVKHIKKSTIRKLQLFFTKHQPPCNVSE